MEFSPKEVGLFRASIDALKEFLPTAQLRCSSAGIGINGMDSGHIGFVDYFLAASDLARCKIPRPKCVGVSLAVLARVLSNVGSSDKLTMSLNEKEDRLVVSYTNDHVSKRGLYEIALTNLNEDALEIPAIDYAADVQAKTSDILTALREVSTFGEFLNLTLDEEGFHVETTGELGSAKQTLENIEGREMMLEDPATPVSAKFAAKFLLGIMKGGGSLSPSSRLEFGAGQPLRASFHYGTSSRFVGYLAPRLEED